MFARIVNPATAAVGAIAGVCKWIGSEPVGLACIMNGDMPDGAHCSSIGYEPIGQNCLAGHLPTF